MKKPEDAIFSSLLFNLEFLYHRRKKGRKKNPVFAIQVSTSNFY